MWEQLWESISTLGNLSLIIVVVAALLYYFGKLIGDAKVEKHERTDCYIEGLFFSLIYVALPFVAVLVLTQYAQLYLPFWLSLLLQAGILGCLWLTAFANEYLKRLGLHSQFKKLSREKIQQLKKAHPIVAIAEENTSSTTKKDYTDLLSLAYYKIPTQVFGNKNVLILFSFGILWSAYSLIGLETTIQPSTILIAILVFLNLTFLAIAYGFATAYYPPAQIVLENGDKISGKVLKFGDFVYVLKENEEKKLFVNKDKIVYVEESLLKEETKGKGAK
jgi:sRNA-binding regulator protein Hfq